MLSSDMFQKSNICYYVRHQSSILCFLSQDDHNTWEKLGYEILLRKKWCFWVGFISKSERYGKEAVQASFSLALLRCCSLKRVCNGALILQAVIGSNTVETVAAFYSHFAENDKEMPEAA
jgi:hypothetical protein